MTPRRSVRIAEQQSFKKHASAKDALSVLPAEIQQEILQYVDDSHSMINLACTSKHYYNLSMSITHKSIAVVPAFYDSIPPVIRRLEPHLSIVQKKQLKREGRYKGQQERFSHLLDPNVVPNCALSVRQMTIGAITVVEKHVAIVVRYLEEVLKNLRNLEVLDIIEPNESMAHTIVALKNLTALRITMKSISEKSALPLTQLHGLQHLAIHSGVSRGVVYGRQEVLQAILARSLSTLRSLDVRTPPWRSNFLDGFEDQIKVHDPEALNQPHYFTSLKSATLAGHCWAENGALPPTTLTTSIDFLKLNELNLTRLSDGNMAFFKYLENSYSKADRGPIQLRKLSLDMDTKKPNPMASEESLEGIYRFLASFDTLTSLKLYNYNAFQENVFPNPGLSGRLQQAVINHKDLESLHFKYERWSPYASARAVEMLTKNLPRLRTLEIPPEDKDLEVMHVARAISHARLRTLIFPKFPKCPNFPNLGYTRARSQDAVQSFLTTFMRALLQVSDIELTLTEIKIAFETFTIGHGFKPKPREKRNHPVNYKSVWVQDMRDIDEVDRQWYYKANSSWASQIMTSIE